MAALACRSALQSHHAREATSERPSPALSLPPGTALEWPRATAATSPSRARAIRGHGSATTHDRPAHHAFPSRRGPAPRPNSGKILRHALRSARLLRSLPPHSAFPFTALLFLLLSPGVTTRPAARSPTPEATSVRGPAATPLSSRATDDGSVHVVTYGESPTLRTILCLPPETEEGAGGPGAPVPPFPLSARGAFSQEAAHGRLAR